MATTIAVGERTLDMLKALRQEEHMGSYDEVIRRLIQYKKKPEQSMRGKAKHTPVFVREEIDRFA